MAADLLTVITGGLFTAEAAIDIGRSLSITSDDIDLAMGSSLSALDVLLRVTSTGEVIIGDGTGSYVLSNAELDRIVTPDIIIDAMANDVRVDDVTFTADTGSNSFNVATTADINLAGDVTASGAGRTFRFGGFASPDMSGDDGLATRVVANIDDASFDFGASTLVVRGEDIAVSYTHLTLPTTPYV